MNRLQEGNKLYILKRTELKRVNIMCCYDVFFVVLSCLMCLPSNLVIYTSGSNELISCKHVVANTI
jgi:hypothetical protein